MKIEINEILKAKQILDNPGNKRFFDCMNEIINTVEKYFPEIKERYGDSFNERVFMTLYIEMIHIGFI